MNFSDRWTEREKRLENDEPTNDTYSDKQKVNIVTGDKDDEEEQPFSGLYCSICRDMATFILNGDSLCYHHYDEAVKDAMKHYKECGHKH